MTDRQVLSSRPTAGSDAAATPAVDLLPRIGHQLREPIGCIIGLIRIMRGRLDRGTVDAAEQTRHLALLEDSAVQLLTTVDRIVEVARVPAGLGSTERVVFDCRDTVAEVAARFTPAAQARGGQVVCDAAAAPVLVSGAPRVLHQLLAELMDNAVSYAGSGPVCLRVRGGVPDRPGSAAGVSIQVIDHGPGITARDAERIFAAFERGQAADGTETVGAGLGLYLARMLAAELGGSIGLASTPGQGCTFTVELASAATTSADP